MQRELPNELLKRLNFDLYSNKNWLVDDWRNGRFEFDHIKYLSYKDKSFVFGNQNLYLEVDINFEKGTFY